MLCYLYWHRVADLCSMSLVTCILSHFRYYRHIDKLYGMCVRDDYEFRFEGRRDLPLPVRFERGPPPPPDGPVDGVRPAAGPLPAPPVAWSRGTEDWKDPWLR